MNGRETRLLPCPFCGGASFACGYQAGDTLLFKAYCSKCPAEMRGFDQCQQDAIDAWNTRPSPAQNVVILTESQRDTLRRIANAKAAGIALHPFWLDFEAALSAAAAERCVKCGRETRGEAALVNGEIWCHPCADMASSRDEVRNDPAISSAVKGAMEYFWKLSDQYDAEAAPSQGEPVADQYVEMLWKWFEDRGVDLKPERSTGLTADDFRLMLDEHEAALSLPAAQSSDAVTPEVVAAVQQAIMKHPYWKDVGPALAFGLANTAIDAYTLALSAADRGTP